MLFRTSPNKCYFCCKDIIQEIKQMTDEGVLMTSKGEAFQPVMFQPAQHIHITSWHQSPGSQKRVINHIGNLDAYLSWSKDKPVRSPAYFAYMVFSVDCNSTYSLKSKSSDFPHFKRYQHNLLFVHGTEIRVDWQKGEDLEVIGIGIDLEFLIRYIPQDNPAFSDLLRSLETKKSAMLNEFHLPVSPKILSVLNEVINCVQKGFCRQLYLEAKVIELLAHQFEQFEETVKRTVNGNIRNEDVEKMQRVRDILISNLNTELSLKELAHAVGTNEYNLKKQFKLVFGNTVFGYLLALKMERSRQLLLQSDVKIAEVSERMGYKHATHFTSAFKKFFGYLPNKVRISSF